jgi:hypothetical protein
MFSILSDFLTNRTTQVDITITVTYHTYMIMVIALYTTLFKLLNESANVHEPQYNIRFRLVDQRTALCINEPTYAFLKCT